MGHGRKRCFTNGLSCKIEKFAQHAAGRDDEGHAAPQLFVKLIRRLNQKWMNQNRR